jgi:putative methionine-R-sulfoxide reductase with GAF domain
VTGQKSDLYRRILTQLEELFEKTTDPISRMATAAAVCKYFLNRGEYGLVTRGGGRRVDGERTVIVPDVHRFPGHIACDARSRSEIVVPLRDGAGRVIGVLDIDSEKPAHFDEDDRIGLEAVVVAL